MANIINAKWENDFHFVATQDHKEIHFDAVSLPGTHDQRISPKAVLLSGLAGCTGMDVVAILNKSKVSFSDLNIEVSGELTETHPKYYHRIHIRYSIKVSEENEIKVNEAIDLSLSKYCGVHEMLSKSATITHSLMYLQN
jgi:putative redox protein